MRYLTPITLALCTASALGSVPSLGGPMSHLLVTLFDNQIYLTYESPSMSSVVMQDSPNDFVGNAAVLNHTGYNAQFGWLANGFISLPSQAGIFVRTISTTPYLNVYEESSFDPILGTGGSDDVWRWDGTMTHNWYSTDTHGPHFARYEVFVGDLLGNPLAGYQSGTIGLAFEYAPDLSDRIGTIGAVSHPATPTPTTLAALATGLGLFTRRKRV